MRKPRVHYRVTELPDSCLIVGMRGAAADLVAGRTVKWSIGSTARFPAHGAIVAQAHGDPCCYLLFRSRDEPTPKVVGLADFFSFAHDDTSGWAHLVVYVSGQKIHDLSWGYDYSEELEEEDIHLEQAPCAVELAFDDEQLRYDGPLTEDVFTGEELDAVVDAFCAKVGITVVGEDYFHCDTGNTVAVAQQYAYYGAVAW